MERFPRSTGLSLQPTFDIDLSKVTKNAFRYYPYNQLAFEGTSLRGPLYVGGSSLGLGDREDPWVDIIDSNKVRLVTHSVQAILRLIEYFDGRDRVSLLAAAAHHYDLDTFDLMGASKSSQFTVNDAAATNEPFWEMLDASGRLLLTGATYHTASLAADQCMLLPGWRGDIIIRSQSHRDAKNPGLLWDWRHEGPLALLHHCLGIASLTFIAVKSHVGRCGMMLEEALRRLDQFSLVDQNELLNALGKHFYLCDNLDAACNTSDQ